MVGGLLTNNFILTHVWLRNATTLRESPQAKLWEFECESIGTPRNNECGE